MPSSPKQYREPPPEDSQAERVPGDLGLRTLADFQKGPPKALTSSAKACVLAEPLPQASDDRKTVSMLVFCFPMALGL